MTPERRTELHTAGYVVRQALARAGLTTTPPDRHHGWFEVQVDTGLVEDDLSGVYVRWQWPTSFVEDELQPYFDRTGRLDHPDGPLMRDVRTAMDSAVAAVLTSWGFAVGVGEEHLGDISPDGVRVLSLPLGALPTEGAQGSSV